MGLWKMVTSNGSPKVDFSLVQEHDASFVHPRSPFPNALRASSESAAILG